MDADVHAICLLAVYPIGIAILAKFGHRPRTVEQWIAATFLFILGFVLVFAAVAPYVVTLCDSPTPNLQWIAPGGLAAIAAATVRPWKMKIVLVALFIVTAIFLCTQYRHLLWSKEQYVGLAAGHPVFTCDKPAAAFPLWHSWFTGVYGVKLDEAPAASIRHK